MADSPVAEHELDEKAIRTLLRTEAPELADLPLRFLTAGWDNAIWRLGDGLAVRVPRRAVAAQLIDNEHRALLEIAPRLASIGIRTPLPVVTGAPTESFPWPWSVTPWIDGRTALTSSRTDNSRWATDLAATLLTLHSPAPPDAPRNPVRGVPLLDRHEAMRARLEARPELDDLRIAWNLGLSASPNAERVWIHGDLHPGNILVDNGRLIALIDFGDVTAGDPAYDLAASWMLFDAAGRERFRAATRGRYDEQTWIRARAWAAYISLVLLTQSDDRVDYLAVGRSTSKELRSPV
jgi:aminoglycoside phosphotransferase (APT) family kinase protein